MPNILTCLIISSFGSTRFGFSTNLDEFYRVRVGSIYDQMIISDKKRENKTYMTSSEQ